MSSVAEQLEKLATLLKDGLITQEQFEAHRDQLFAESSGASAGSAEAGGQPEQRYGQTVREEPGAVGGPGRPAVVGHTLPLGAEHPPPPPPPAGAAPHPPAAHRHGPPPAQAQDKLSPVVVGCLVLGLILLGLVTVVCVVAFDALLIW